MQNKEAVKAYKICFSILNTWRDIREYTGKNNGIVGSQGTPLSEWIVGEFQHGIATRSKS